MVSKEIINWCGQLQHIQRLWKKKYGKSVAQQLSNPRNYISRSQADAMGLGTEKGTKQYNPVDIRGIVEEVGKNKESAYDKEYWDQFLKLDPELTGY